MKVAKSYSKYCGTCHRVQLVEYGEKDKYLLLRCAVCKAEHSRTDYDTMYERLMKVALEPGD